MAIEQTVRDFLDDILESINVEVLTDEEADDVELANAEYSVASYAQLKAVLEARDAVSDVLYRLAFFYLSKGVRVATVNTSAPLDAEAPKQPTSQILIGLTLEC